MIVVDSFVRRGVVQSTWARDLEVNQTTNVVASKMMLFKTRNHV